MAPSFSCHGDRVHALFVHGMGRSTLSGWQLLARLKAQGITPHAFGYVATFQRFDSICHRLTERILALSAEGDYMLIGHSLGGVLLRAADIGFASSEAFTLQTDRGVLSFFSEGETCLSILHRGANFEPGVREKLILITRGVARLVS